MKSFVQKGGTLLRVCVTLALLTWLALKVHWSEVGAQLRKSDPLWLLIACLLLGVTFFLASIRWWLLLRVQAIRLPLRTVSALTLIGHFFNSFMLGSMGGDVVKILYIVKYSPQKKAHATLSIVLDRALGLFVLLACALVVLPWQLPTLMRQEQTRTLAYALVITFVLILGGGIGLALLPFKRLPAIFHRIWRRVPHRQILEALIDGFRRHGSAKNLTLGAATCAIVLYFIIFGAGYCIARAIHLEVSFIQILIILAIVICAISLPISIGGHGVRESVFVLMFAVFGVITINKQTGAGQEPAILFSLLYFALYSVWSLAGGLVYLTFRHSFDE